MKKVLFFLTLFILLSTPSRVLAETMTIKTNADTFANEAYPDKDYSGTGSIIIGNSPIWRFGYLKFPYPAMPEGANIEEISIRFYVHERNYSNDVKIAIGVTNSEWEENTVTFNHTPSRWANELAVETFYVSEGWNERDITRLFEETIDDKTILNRWKDGDDTGFTILPWDMVDGDATIDDFVFSFKSKEATEPELAAELEIDYSLPPTPTPTSTPTITPSPTPTNTPTPKPTVEEEETTAEAAEEEGDNSDSENETPPEEEEENASSGFDSKQTTNFILAMVIALVGLIAIAAVFFGSQKKDRQQKKSKKESKQTQGENKEETSKNVEEE